MYDLLILVDATYSMDNYLKALQPSLSQIIPISALTGCFSRIGLLAYRDYCDRELLKWSGWLSPSCMSDNPEVDLVKMAKNLEAIGGGDEPEAIKTGLARAYELMRADATTIIFLYTDAPPHTFANGEIHDRDSLLGPELQALQVKSSYGNFGPQFQDWVSAANMLSGRVGDKKAQVFSFLDNHMKFGCKTYYLYLCYMTGGACFFLDDIRPANISKVTVEILLAWMGTEKAGTSESAALPAFLLQYNSLEGITELNDERDPAAGAFFPIAPNTGNFRGWACTVAQACSDVLMPGADAFAISHYTGRIKTWDCTFTQASPDVLTVHLPKKKTAVESFAQRYVADPPYRVLVVDNLRAIIKDDVAAISFNPVFGSLWRAVCNDRQNAARDELITAFGLEVDRIRDAGEKARVKAWLEESYDYTAEVQEAINSVPLEQRFPCVCLDPTLAFGATTVDGPEEENDNRLITSFRRDELLEIGRSCHYKVLRRLGRVLTRLTYINSIDEMPAHIAAAPETEIPRIPLSLATAEHKRKFWKILLHIVVPGTMLSARPAALLAALSIRLGVRPLLPAAYEEMSLWRRRWNDPDIPETWNVDCLSLLLDADEASRKRAGADEESTLQTVLLPQDRALFELLVSYKMLELNLSTTLTATVGWTPQKTRVPLGPTVVCKSCEYPRSVTIMGENGTCGCCLFKGWESEEKHSEIIRKHVTKDDTESTPATWVECCVRTCRAQYVVYCPEMLNVSPKCHYCRFSREAPPVIECSVCLSRIIWPVEYRPSDIADYKCHICISGHKTIVEVETTAAQLSKQNTYSWLVRNDGKLPELFNNRSLYHTVSTCGIADICNKVELFPTPSQQHLTLSGKSLFNTTALIQELQHWVFGRRTESKTCSLCFSSKRNLDLTLACGRTGCHQRICRGCMQGWYGLNDVGHIINTAALSCPYCRRAPTSKILAKYGMGIHEVANLQAAVEERGTWIYGWCQVCYHARRYMERVCAAGAPEEQRDWTCAHCCEIVADRDHIRLEDMKECPGCGVMTDKTGGCNHITCSTPGCGAHWCFICGGKFDEETIYPHMNAIHGGYANPVDDDEEFV